IVAVGDIELRARVLEGRIRPREGKAGGGELVGAKEGKAVGERLLVDMIDAHARRERAGRLGNRLRLSRVHPDNRREIAEGGGNANRADDSVSHREMLRQSPEFAGDTRPRQAVPALLQSRSEEHTSELQSL